jgi:hypothetical protein
VLQIHTNTAKHLEKPKQGTYIKSNMKNVTAYLSQWASLAVYLFKWLPFNMHKHPNTLYSTEQPNHQIND